VAQSIAERLASLTEYERRTILSGVPANLLIYAWPVWARPEQMEPPGDWNVWLIKAGRGWGKTRTGAEWIRSKSRNKDERMALIGRTAADLRDVMVEGPSGVLSVFSDDEKPVYESSKRRITFKSGAIANTYSADEPDLLRGPQHSAIWADEMAAWRYDRETWDNAMMGMRIGPHPSVCVTTTPRPTALIRELMKRSDCIVTGGTTYDNAGNLAANFLSEILQKYEGTRLGRQEINAELLEDNPGALWSGRTIESLRVRNAPAMRRIVVAIDPAVTSRPDSDETGIIGAGLGEDGHAYVMSDLSGIMVANEWATTACNWYEANGADRIIAETNNGGDLVEATIRTVNPHASYRSVTATRGKAIRAEPIAALYEQGKVHHVGQFPTLEDQMTTYDPATSKKSPDRMDALVWALTELMLHDNGSPSVTIL
jgi:phage terminase large subunit-like protein